MSRSIPPQLEVDICADDARPGELGAEIVRKLGVKGFCVVQLGLNDRILMEQAAEEIPGELPWLFRGVHPLVADALLGEEGSACVARVDSDELQEMALEDQQEHTYEALRLVAHKLQDMGYTQLKPHTSSMLNFDLVSMGEPLLHRASPEEPMEPEELTELEHSSWLDTFTHHRVMSIFFLGPGTGSLSLFPYENDEAELYRLPTSVGMMVVLRPDILEHTWSYKGRSFAMSIFGLRCRHPERVRVEMQATCPAARDLENLRIHRLAGLKLSEFRALLGGGYDMRQVPRSWQKAMNQRFHTREMMSVRGSGCRMPGHCTNIRDWTMWGMNAEDYAKQVPFQRWDYHEVYSPEEESWQENKSYCKHGTFIEGIYMFDCRRFGIPYSEAQEMDPHQRLTLEVGYEALHRMGRTKNTLVNAYAGVYTGCGDSEWGFSDDVANLGVRPDLGVSAGRFAFCLGLSGPSLNVNTDGSSSLVALHMASESLWCGNKDGVEFSVAVGVHLCLAPTFWPSWCASLLLSRDRHGRCRSFDNSATGYIRGEGCCSVAVSRGDDPYDAEAQQNEEGKLVASCVKSGGIGANLSTPSAQAEQEAMVDALKLAGIKPMDVDYVEAHGSGEFLADAVEVMSYVRVHRLLTAAEEEERPLMLSALKSSAGNQVACGGLASFLRSLAAANRALLLPNLHLHLVNDHLGSDLPILYNGEGQEMPDSNPIMGTFARGYGGSYAYVVCTGQPEEDRVSWPVLREDCLVWWPGGGGVQILPRGEYYLSGSWSSWEPDDATKMKMESRGVYTGMVTLGENCWEMFQIWVDRDSQRALYPKKWLRAPNETEPEGPGFNSECCWLLDGRRKAKDRKEEEADAGEWVLVDAPAPADAESLERTTQSLDTGQPGDRYRVKLQIKGAWALVSWEWFGPPLRNYKSQAATYHIVGSWNDWHMEDAIVMDADPKEPGLFHGQVTLERDDGAEFQIVRNEDTCQVLYPSKRCTESDCPVQGPDYDGWWDRTRRWVLTGTAGDVFNVNLTRKWCEGVDVKRVSWELVSKVELKKEQLEMARAPRFCIFWEDETMTSMLWDGTCYSHEVRLPDSGEVLFYIVQDGQTDLAWFPSVRGATTWKFHKIKGPGPNERKIHWSIGRDERDLGCLDQVYKVKMFLKDDQPNQVTWRRVAGFGGRELGPKEPMTYSPEADVLVLAAGSSTTKGIYSVDGSTECSTESSPRGLRNLASPPVTSGRSPGQPLAPNGLTANGSTANGETANGPSEALNLASPDQLPSPGVPAESSESASDWHSAASSAGATA